MLWIPPAPLSPCDMLTLTMFFITVPATTVSLSCTIAEWANLIPLLSSKHEPHTTILPDVPEPELIVYPRINIPEVRDSNSGTDQAVARFIELEALPLSLRVRFERYMAALDRRSKSMNLSMRTT